MNQHHGRQTNPHSIHHQGIRILRDHIHHRKHLDRSADFLKGSAIDAIAAADKRDSGRLHV